MVRPLIAWCLILALLSACATLAITALMPVGYPRFWATAATAIVSTVVVLVMLWDAWRAWREPPMPPRLRKRFEEDFLELWDEKDFH